MYYISKDKRVIKSAELIWLGLEKCLLEKELKKIRVTDINEKSYVSRATFYRLFDSIEDVLSYQCNQVFEELSTELAQEHFTSNSDLFLFFIEKWLKQKTLVRTLAENNITGVIYEVHLKNSELMKQIFVKTSQLSDIESNYLVSILTNILPAVMHTWYTHGQTESPKEIYEITKKSLLIIADVLND